MKPPVKGKPKAQPKGQPKKASATASPGRPKGARAAFPIVGIGASAGGLEAFTQLLKSLPSDTGMGFVLVQHLDPTHESVLTQLLARATAMPVREVTDDLQVEPNHVYIIPPNTSLTIAQGMLKLKSRRRASGSHHSIDVFFESLAHDHGAQAIGIILSGTASDGTLGLEAIKAENGIAFAQDDSAKYNSMPHSAIAAGCVDFVLSPAGIAAELTRLARHPYVAEKALAPVVDESPKSVRPNVQGGFKDILLLMRNRFNVDFSQYKPGTFERRIARRMALHRLDTLAAYTKLLRDDAAELKLLYSDVLIGVTGFFRNPEVFAVLQREVFPALIARKSDEPVRVWTLGCSTGQEAYSLAMAFMECAERTKHSATLQVFATDLNETMLERARAGLYAKAMLHGVSPARLRRFFVEEPGGYRVIKSLRESVVFARQNVLSDPPFSRMDLVSCRNVMIYLEPSLQKRILPLFHYALQPDGFLLLGLSESIGAHGNLFAPVDKKFKIYSKNPGVTAILPSALRGSPPTRSSALIAARARDAEKERKKKRGGGVIKPLHTELNAEREADRVALRRFAPPGVLIDAALRIVQFRGDVNPYLALPHDRANFSVLSMAHAEVLPALRAAINKAKRDNATVRTRELRIARGRATLAAEIEVIPLKNLKDRCYLILFDASRNTPAANREPVSETRAQPRAEARRIRALEQDLAETRDYVEALQQHEQSSNEELRAASEEFQSANEELQSINEELETSKEELESTNEELITVNEEMVNRNAELGRVNDELLNLHQSISLPILVLGSDLTVRRFTTQAQKIFHLVPTDVGRSLARVKHELECPDLEQFILAVIDAATVNECEVQDKHGRWYLLRVRPYITAEKKVDGAVVVLLDIDALKRSTQGLKHARDYAEATLRTARDPLVVLRADLHVNTANEAFYRAFRLTREEVEGKSFFDLCDGAWAIPKLQNLLEEILPRNSYFNDFEVITNFHSVGRRTLLLNARQLDSDENLPQLILLSIEDVTERLESREALRVSENRFRRVFEAARDGILLIDPISRKIVDANPYMTELLGYAREEFLGKELWQIGLLKDEPSSHAAFRELQEKGFIRYEHLPLETQAGAVRDVEFVSNAYVENGHELIQCNIRDITERKRGERELRASEERFHAIADNAPVMIWMADADGRATYFNKGWIDFVGRAVAEKADPWYEAIHVDDRARSVEARAQAVAARAPFETEYRLARHDGVYRLVLNVGTPRFAADGRFIGFIGSCVDITERRRGEEEVARSNKLESIGVLAGGIAHDFNNLLTAISGNIYLAKSTLAPTDDVYQYLTETEHACARAEDLTQRLLTFARGGAPLTQTMSVGEVLVEWVGFALRGSNVKLTSEVAPDLVAVDVDEGQLSQVVNNLVTNAREAMPNGGTLALKIQNIQIDAASKLPLHSGNYVAIALRDTGVGIPPGNLSKIFDPFFTTKAKGSGLGLATSYAIVQKHGGHLAVASEFGVGTTFTIYLPASSKPAVAPPMVVQDDTPETGKILFMDDEAAICRFAREVLTQFGYTVECVADGHAALERYRQAMEDGDPFTGVILDLTVPGGMGGDEAMRRLVKLDIKVRAVVSSGYSNDPVMASFQQHGFCARLPKPFQMHELRQAVRAFRNGG